MAAPPAAEAKVFLHIGEPKTGTTFIQQVMWSNRAELAAEGVVLPGHHPQDHYRASQDLRGIQKLPSDPAIPLYIVLVVMLLVKGFLGSLPKPVSPNYPEVGSKSGTPPRTKTRHS